MDADGNTKASGSGKGTASAQGSNSATASATGSATASVSSSGASASGKGTGDAAADGETASSEGGRLWTLYDIFESIYDDKLFRIFYFWFTLTNIYFPAHFLYIINNN